MNASLADVCAIAIVVLVSALGETMTAPPIQPAPLGGFEAMVTYCEKVDPASESQYLSRLVTVMGRLSNDQIQAERNSGPYHHVKSLANERLSRLTQSAALQSCSEFFAEK